jgi:hypothetical protein
MTILNFSHPDYFKIVGNKVNSLRPNVQGLYFMENGDVIGTDKFILFVSKGLFNNFPEGFIPANEVLKLQKFINTILVKSKDDYTEVTKIGEENEINILRIVVNIKGVRHSLEVDFWPKDYQNKQFSAPQFYNVIPDDENILATERMSLGLPNLLNFTEFLKPILKDDKAGALETLFFGPTRAVKMNYYDIDKGIVIKSIVMPLLNNY